MKRSSRTAQPDPSTMLDRIRELAVAPGPVAGKLTDLLTEYGAMRRAASAALVSKLAIDDDVAKAEKWLRSLVRKPRPKSRDGLWFGIVEYEGNVHDCYAALVPRRGNLEPSEWGFGRPIYATPRDAGARVLTGLLGSDLVSKDGSDRFGFGLAYVAFLAAHLVRSSKQGALQGVTVAVGYDDGDSVLLGVVGPEGFQEPPAPKPPRRGRPKPLPTGELLFMTEERPPNRLVLACLLTAADKEPPDDYAQRGRRERAQELTVQVYDKCRPGPLLDLSTTFAGDLIVSARCADLIERMAPRSIQRLRAPVTGVSTTSEVLNIVKRIPLESLLAWDRGARKPVAGSELGKHALARAGMGRAWTHIVVHRNLAQAMMDAGLTGIAFRSIEREDLRQTLRILSG